MDKSNEMIRSKSGSNEIVADSDSAPPETSEKNFFCRYDPKTLEFLGGLNKIGIGVLNTSQASPSEKWIIRKIYNSIFCRRFARFFPQFFVGTEKYFLIFLCNLEFEETAGRVRI